MQKSAPIIFVVIVLIVTVAATAQTKLRGDISLHHFQLSCNRCHTPQLVDNISGKTTIGKIEGDINKVCASSAMYVTPISFAAISRTIIYRLSLLSGH